MSMLQLLGGVAAAGVVAAGTTALTGTGVAWGGSGTGQATQYVGGTLTQTVSGGATITGVNYTTSADGTQLTAIQVVVTGASGAYLTVTPSTDGAGLAGGANRWKCTGNTATTTTNISATAPKVLLNNASATINCATWDTTAGGGSGANGGYYAGLTGVQLDVTNS